MKKEETKVQRSVHTLPLRGEMTIANAGELKPMLAESLAGCSILELDLTEVTDMDTAGFQLLLLLKKEADLQGKSFRLLSCSQKVVQILDFYRMKDFFASDGLQCAIRGEEDVPKIM